MIEKIIIFDFEIYKYDTLLGAKVFDSSGQHYYQSWDIDEIRNFYKENVNNLWVGHNNKGYDNYMLESVISGKNPYNKSVEIVEKNIRPSWLRLPLINYDIMDDTFFSLKSTEAWAGKNISETQVDFRIDRPLNDEEKELVESYNRDDLDQTSDNFFDRDIQGGFNAKLDLITMFNLDLKYLTRSGASIAAKILGAKAIPGIEYQYIKPKLYDTLRLKNEQLLDFYINEKFRNGEHLTLNICGTDHVFGGGGCHAGDKCDVPKALYLDVSGYYNLIMMLYNLFPRTIPEEGKEIYKELYYKQLEYKKTAPEKRPALKIVLLAVWGSTLAQYSDFYDPQVGSLITITGQIFTVDLLEKLEGLIKVVQTNTDGIIVEPLNWDTYDLIINKVEEWEKRTGFTIKKDLVYDIHQRDVNNYMYRDAKGNIHVKGEAVKHYDSLEHPLGNKIYDSKESMIIAKCIVEYFMNNKSPEKTIEENKRNLRMFQQVCKKGSFQYTEYELLNIKTNEISTTRLQGVNRVFALKSNELIGTVQKHKIDNRGIHKKSKVSNLPDSVFVYDDEILSNETVDHLIDKIDYNYYINRAYERICEFLDIPQIKDIKL